jgi:hypothetical protein
LTTIKRNFLLFLNRKHFYLIDNGARKMYKISAFKKCPAFTFHKLDFLFMPTYSEPDSNVFFFFFYGNGTTALRLAIVNSVKPCDPRSSVNFTYFMWKTFAYYYTNYAMVVLPSRTSDNKILYKRYYKAEIGGDNSRTCKMCVCKLRDIHMFYNFGCKKPNPFFIYCVVFNK